jgi:YHS domain-containing protein
MDGLLSFLLFAGFFYLMMRFGCGAHMIHGHTHTRHSKGDGKDVDPVCHIQVDIEKGYGKMHLGTLYRFCSRGCLDKFEAEPERFVNQELEKPHDDA